ncbi:hypothetical protein M413DRAFT_428012 [Hebeloma cylindrosporum]|uniref:DUF6589 domain-containing protein n=1 Tax=Hebeloma cylindrosporum TaxID=76867 RepID=A0A0C2XDY7_HEBCY|nr:hypothetical protein M413DRAFT_428012 [Hebeloma cylindrosporum h7]
MTAVMQHFFNGRGEKYPALILANWLRHPYGRHDRDSDLNFSTVDSSPYTEIRPVRPALTSFAAQIVEQKLVQEIEKAVHPSSGLHVSISTKKKDPKAEARRVKWTDIGNTTMERTQKVIQSCQPLTWKLIMKLASRPPRVRNNEVALRQKRPPEFITTGVISSLNFSRSSQAKLLPLAAGLLYIGSSASTDLFRFRSRLGNTPAYSSVIRAMRTLSEHEGAVTLAHGSDPKTIGIIRLDNVQNYLLQRDPAMDRAMLQKSLRKDLTVQQLQGMIDHAHLETVCMLQWINTLLQYIPELAHLKPNVSLLYRTRAAKQRLPVKAAKVHPLASSSGNETILTEFKEALQDFFNQTGQTSDSFKKRLFPVGGDGLTYEKMLQLQEYLQFHDNEYDSMELLEPVLEWWHTEWTNLSRIFESYWGPSLTDDPSYLGHSASRIGRKKPSNLKKVDFYTSSELAFLVLDVRILDCWRLYFNQEDLFAYFKSLSATKSLPSFEDLEAAAQKLYRAYTSLRAQEQAMCGSKRVSKTVPRGKAWPTQIDVALVQGKEGAMARPFLGDQFLARSIGFIRETMMAREMSLATAEGDVGRIWEIIKVMLFTFAGSSHSNYTKYLLEMITNLELESSPELRQGMLHITLVNLTGREGHWSAGDFIQEYFNRLLEAIVQRKGVEYGDQFIRNVWSRNIHHIARLKLTWLDGVGLKSRSSGHTGAKLDAEIRILMELYKECELHSLRPGRREELMPFIDDFQRGVRNLQAGKLQKWIIKTTRSRRLKNTQLPRMPPPEETSGVNSDSDESDDEPEIPQYAPHFQESLSMSTVVGGNLILNSLEVEEDLDDLFQSMEKQPYEDGRDSDSSDDSD